MSKTTKSRLTSASEIMKHRPLPTLSIDSRDLSTVKNMEIGKVYTFKITAKVLALNVGDEYGGYWDEDDEHQEDKSTHARLRITKITEK